MVRSNKVRMVKKVKVFFLLSLTGQPFFLHAKCTCIYATRPLLHSNAIQPSSTEFNNAPAPSASAPLILNPSPPVIQQAPPPIPQPSQPIDEHQQQEHVPATHHAHHQESTVVPAPVTQQEVAEPSSASTVSKTEAKKIALVLGSTLATITVVSGVLFSKWHKRMNVQEEALKILGNVMGQGLEGRVDRLVTDMRGLNEQIQTNARQLNANNRQLHANAHALRVINNERVGTRTQA